VTEVLEPAAPHSGNGSRPAATRGLGATRPSTRDLSVIVPVRNAERMIERCLEAVVANDPLEIIVVDGDSTDRTLELAHRYPVTVISDGGSGVAAARMMGAELAQGEWVALVDVDVVLQPGALQALLDEAVEGDHAALQAGLHSMSGRGYWGRALADHHRSGRSREWFGLVATVFHRDTFLATRLDASFASGEDIEVRWRLRDAGARYGVSRRTVVEHWFDDSFDTALGQWLMDGSGHAATALKHGWRAAPLLLLPLAAGVRGSVLSVVRRRPEFVPYYVLFVVFNQVGMLKHLWRRVQTRRP
jgi:glycosyltransferase involved in cell wall biosynthesis